MNNPLNNDEKKLKELMTQKVSKEFEEHFWNEFDKLPKKEVNSIWNLKLLAPAMMIVVAVLIFNNQNQVLNKEEMFQLAANTELLENYDMLEDLDEELIDLSDEEWEVILAQS